MWLLQQNGVLIILRLLDVIVLCNIQFIGLIDFVNDEFFGIGEDKFLGLLLLKLVSLCQLDDGLLNCFCFSLQT